MQNFLHTEICPHCAEEMPTMINEPGEFAVCFMCMEPSIMAANMELRTPTNEEINDYINDLHKKRPPKNIDFEKIDHDVKLARFLTQIHLDKEHKKSYSILKNNNGVEFIICYRCDKASYNPNDIKNKYCGNCKKFHEN